jgi:polyisoprenoid-binding protein YceI
MPLLAAAVLTAVVSAPSGGRVFIVDATASEVRIHVGKAGLLKLAGHEHEVVTTAIEGDVAADGADVSAARIRLRFPTASLRVREEGEPAGDAPKVQAKMEGPDVLDVSRFPEATFTSRRLEVHRSETGRLRLVVEGDFALHGVTRALKVPVDVALDVHTLTATGTLVLRHRDFDMKPVSVAGVVKVKEEIGIDFKIVAREPLSR